LTKISFGNFNRIKICWGLYFLLTSIQPFRVPNSWKYCNTSITHTLRAWEWMPKKFDNDSHAHTHTQTHTHTHTRTHTRTHAHTHMIRKSSRQQRDLSNTLTLPHTSLHLMSYLLQLFSPKKLFIELCKTFFNSSNFWERIWEKRRICKISKMTEGGYSSIFN